MDAEDVVVESTDRRSFLRRAALTAGAVWTVPVIQSLSTPAYAVGSDPAGGGTWFQYQFGFSLVPRPLAIQTWVLAASPIPASCAPAGYLTAESAVLHVNGIDPGNGARFGTGAGTITIIHDLPTSVVTITLASTGCSLAASALSAGQCLPFSAGAAPGTFTVTVPNVNGYVVSGVIC